MLEVSDEAGAALAVAASTTPTTEPSATACTPRFSLRRRMVGFGRVAAWVMASTAARLSPSCSILVAADVTCSTVAYLRYARAFSSCLLAYALDIALVAFRAEPTRPATNISQPPIALLATGVASGIPARAVA